MTTTMLNSKFDFIAEPMFDMPTAYSEYLVTAGTQVIQYVKRTKPEFCISDGPVAPTTTLQTGKVEISSGGVYFSEGDKNWLVPQHIFENALKNFNHDFAQTVEYFQQVWCNQPLYETKSVSWGTTGQEGVTVSFIASPATYTTAAAIVERQTPHRMIDVDPEPPVILDKVMAIDLLTRAVQERGENYVYDAQMHYGRCRYYHPDQQRVGCMVGLALSYLGLGNDVIESLDGFGSINRSDLLEHLRLNGVQVTPDAAYLLRAAQRTQDSLGTWGDALRQAKSYA